ncbi:MAG TPA: ROK family protein [Bacteroidia bacterium]|nr:ROK family protein [Bacteroidia bacterium]
MKTEVVAGIDIGGTNTEIGLVDKSGVILFSERSSTRSYDTPDKFVKDAARILRTGIEKTKTNLIGIGIGAPSANYYSGSIEFAPNMPWTGLIPLAEMVSEEMNVDCKLTNDANAAALGELLFGDAKFLRDFVVVTLGTGLGSGFVVNGEVLYGHDGFAGELGHVIVERNGRLCGCGRKGCLETYVSATGIVITAKEWLEFEGEKTELKKVPIGEVTGKLITDAAVRGDLVALRLMDFTAEKLAFALANMVAITSPSHIFLYGGLAKAGDLLLNPTEKYFDEFILRNYKGKVELKLSGLPENVAVLGAAALGWKEAER